LKPVRPVHTCVKWAITNQKTGGRRRATSQSWTEDVFVVLDGVQIAKRGHPGTLRAGTWISLEPGWSVSDNVESNKLTVTFESVRVH
jgi:hypothetical protein